MRVAAIEHATFVRSTTALTMLNQTTPEPAASPSAVWSIATLQFDDEVTVATASNPPPLPGGPLVDDHVERRKPIGLVARPDPSTT